MTLKVIGKARRRVDGRAKVTGLTKFADDVVLPRMVHCRLLRSPHPHAEILEIDVGKAEKHPGVHLILTGKDFPVTFGIMPVAQDEYGSVGLLLPPFHQLLRQEGSILIEQPQAQPDQCHRGGNDHRKKQEAEPARTTSHWE